MALPDNNGREGPWSQGGWMSQNKGILEWWGGSGRRSTLREVKGRGERVGGMGVCEGVTGNGDNI